MISSRQAKLVASITAAIAQARASTDAARLDGATGWQLFCHLTLPAIAGTLAFVLFILPVLAFTVSDLVSITTSGGPGQPPPTASFPIPQAPLPPPFIGRAPATPPPFLPAFPVGSST